MAVPEQPWFLFVRFEQGRGVTGVPKTWVPYMVGHPKDAAKKPAIETLVRMAVELFRAGCADPHTGHGRDLMPGSLDEYTLHKLDGGVIARVEDIPWQAGTIGRAEVVLVWRSPADLLLER